MLSSFGHEKYSSSKVGHDRKSLRTIALTEGYQQFCPRVYMLHSIRRIRPLLTQKVMKVLVQALFMSHLDYCNSLLAGLLASAIRPLQLIQNAAARLVFDLSSLTSLLLRSLHWLPVAAHIQFKTLVLCVPCCERIGPSLHPGHG